MRKKNAIAAAWMAVCRLEGGDTVANLAVRAVCELLAGLKEKGLLRSST